MSLEERVKGEWRSCELWSERATSRSLFLLAAALAGREGALLREENTYDTDVVRHTASRVTQMLPSGLRLEPTKKPRLRERRLVLEGDVRVDLLELLAAVRAEGGGITLDDRVLKSACIRTGLRRSELPELCASFLRKVETLVEPSIANGVLKPFMEQWINANKPKLAVLAQEAPVETPRANRDAHPHEWAVEKVGDWLDVNDPGKPLFLIVGAQDSGKSGLCKRLERRIRDKGAHPLRYVCGRRSTAADIFAAARAELGREMSLRPDQDVIDFLESVGSRYETIVIIVDGPERAIRQEPAQHWPIEDLVVELVGAIEERETLWHVRVICATTPDAILKMGGAGRPIADLSSGAQAEDAVRRFVHHRFEARAKRYERHKVERLATGVGADLGFADDLCRLAFTEDLDAALDAVGDGATDWYERRAGEIAARIEREPGVRDVFAVLAAAGETGISRTLLQSCTRIDESEFVAMEREYAGLIRRANTDAWAPTYVIGRPFLREALRRLTHGLGDALLARHMLDRWSETGTLDELLVIQGVRCAVAALKENRPEVAGRESELLKLVTDVGWTSLRWKIDNGRGFALDLAEVAGALERGEFGARDRELRRRVEETSKVAPHACRWAEADALDGEPWPAMAGAATCLASDRYVGFIAEARRHAHAHSAATDLAILETADVTRPPELRWSITGSGRSVSRIVSLRVDGGDALALERGVGEWSILRRAAGVERRLPPPECGGRDRRGESDGEIAATVALSEYGALVAGTFDGGLFYYSAHSGRWSERFDFHHGEAIEAICRSHGAVTTSVSQNVLVRCDWSNLQKTPKIFEKKLDTAGPIRSLLPLDEERVAVLREASLEVVFRSAAGIRAYADLRGAETSAFVFDPVSERLFLATGTDDVDVWDVAALRQLEPLRGHDAVVTCAAGVPCGYVATGAKDRTVRVWHTVTGREVACLRLHAGELSAIEAGSLSGRSFVAAVDRAGLLSVTDVEAAIAGIGKSGAGAVLRAHRGEVGAISVLPGGEIVTSARESFQMRAWWPHERALSSRPPQVARVRSLVFTPRRGLRALTRRGVYKLGKGGLSGPFPLDLPLAATEDGFEGSGSAYLAADRVAVGLSGGMVAVVDVERARVLDHVQIEPVAQAISSIARVSADTAVVGTSRGLVLLAIFDANRRRLVVGPPLVEASWPVDIVCSLAARRLAYTTREDRGRPFVHVIEGDGAPVAAASLVRDDVPLLPVALADGLAGRLLWATRTGLLGCAPVEGLDDPATWLCWRAHQASVTGIVALSDHRALSFSDTDVVLSDPAEGRVVGRLDAAGRIHALSRLPDPRGAVGARRFDWWRLAVGQTVDAVTIWQLATSPV